MSQFKIKVTNEIIASFLDINSVTSLIKTNNELKDDLHNVPFKTFVIDRYSGMNEIKLLCLHTSVIEHLEIDSFEFINHILFPMPKLKTLKVTNCKVDHSLLKIYTSLERLIVN